MTIHVGISILRRKNERAGSFTMACSQTGNDGFSVNLQSGTAKERRPACPMAHEVKPQSWSFLEEGVMRRKRC
jgi:hypothetical protein